MILKLIILISLFFNNSSSNYIRGPISIHFDIWLKMNGYDYDDFASITFGNNGSFGGKKNDKSTIRKRPIIFIHGNSDGALDDGTMWGSGWNSNLKSFMNEGYNMGELYGITWGDRNYLNAMQRTFNCNNVERIRRFIIAVLEYTKYDSINVVAHSMGVTLTRKAIKGGIIEGIDGSCDIGESISHKIKTFVSISGGNYGLCFCGNPLFSTLPSCNKINGFWPGNDCTAGECGKTTKVSCPQYVYSKFLQNLNEDDKLEAQYILSIFSTKDELIGNGNIVFNNYTSRLPFFDEQVISNEWTHMETKEKSFPYIVNMIKKHDNKNIFKNKKI
uniref:Lipase EstA/Esterase EstB family-containing protein n=1 Tax=Strongyloides venezuelensis TaxID=75913 RepID=A0A0K0F3Z7_STRVS